MTESVTTLPFNRHVGIQLCLSGDGLLELPSGEQFLNHIGTVHAGAQLTLAEACSGEFLLRSVSGISDIVPVVRRVEAKFRKAASGRLTAKVTAVEPAVADALEQLARRGRCVIRVSVDVVDELNQQTLSATIEWFAARSS
ncbi:MAG: DUF4442 domain-containing protein [Planctomycetaceae bacterium]